MNDLSITTISNSPIGCIEIAAGNDGLRWIHLLGSTSANTVNNIAGDSSLLAQQYLLQAARQITEFLQKKRTVFDLPIDWSSMTPFQKKVLDATYRIPFGEIWTYGQLAKYLGNPAASRAVGGALARNPLPLVVPCHRVVASTGALTGFSAADGVRTKQWLLEMEGHTIVDQKLG